MRMKLIGISLLCAFMLYFGLILPAAFLAETRFALVGFYLAHPGIELVYGLLGFRSHGLSSLILGQLADFLVYWIFSIALLALLWKVRRSRTATTGQP